MISKADPADYKQELARLGYVLNLNLKEENKDDSPTKTAKKMQVSIAAYTLDQLLQSIREKGPEALRSG